MTRTETIRLAAEALRAGRIDLSQGNLFGTTGIGGQRPMFNAGDGGKMKAATGDDGHWVTIHGAHVLIRHGENVAQALRKYFDKTDKPITHEHVAGAVRQIKLQGGRPNIEPKDLHAAPKPAAPQSAPPAPPTPAPAADRNAGVVDPNRQLGMFATDAKGQHTEVGEKVGQGSLFGNTAKPPAPPAAPKDADAKLREKFDETATPSMFQPPASPDAATTPATPSEAERSRVIETAGARHPTLPRGAYIKSHASIDDAVKDITAHHKLHKPTVRAKLAAGEAFGLIDSHFQVEHHDPASKHARVALHDKPLAQWHHEHVGLNLSKAIGQARSRSQVVTPRGQNADVDRQMQDAHRQHVAAAIAAGISIHPRVLADHPGVEGSAGATGPKKATNLSAARTNAIAAGKRIVVPLNEAPVMLSAVGDVLYLSAASNVRPVLTLGSNLPKEINGLQIHYRWVDAAYAGDWAHPKTGRAVPITNQRIDDWVGKIKLSRSRGVNLPVCKDHNETADNSVGEIFDARRTGGRLDLLLGFKGDDALKVGQRNYLSIGIDGNFRDSRKNSYGEAIRHVAVTPVPVIHGQTGFLAG